MITQLLIKLDFCGYILLRSALYGPYSNYLQFHYCSGHASANVNAGINVDPVFDFLLNLSYPSMAFHDSHQLGPVIESNYSTRRVAHDWPHVSVFQLGYQHWSINQKMRS